MENFLNITLNQISKVYNGKRSGCRCGCKGNYVSTSFNKNHYSDVNDKLVERRLEKAKLLISKGSDYEIGDNYIDIETGDDRTLTFYFNR
jgi:hypothetical protein